MNPSFEPLDLSNQNLCNSAWLCYQAGFAGEPWNEWKRCPNCDTSYGLSIGTKSDCPACSGPLDLYWPTSQIEQEIRESLLLPKSHCSIARINDKVIGLVLGYALSPSQLSAQLGIRIPSQHLEVAYQDEVVVHPDYQSRGLGHRLYQEWITWAQLQRLPQVVARTLAHPPSVVYQWYQRIGYSISARYPAPDNRVILSLDL